MLGQHFATILAQTDPFDVAQGLERYIRSLSGEQVRIVILAASSHMNESYRDEFLPLLEEQNDERLKTAFAQALKSNLRAIPLFGPAFCEGVIVHTPGDRAIGLGEEGYRFPQVRPTAIAIIAVALLLGGAAAEHVWSSARATAQTPAVLPTQPPVAVVNPVPPPSATASPTASPAPARTAGAVAAAVRAPTATPPPATSPPPTEEPATVPPASAPAPRTAEPSRTPEPSRSPRAVRTPPPGHGVATVVATEHTPEPSPEPTAVDVEDMPRAYTDATPLPRYETPSAAHVAPVSIATPTPGPNRYWLHSTIQGTLKTLDHLNPFRHNRSTPSPSPSPTGPQPP